MDRALPPRGSGGTPETEHVTFVDDPNLPMPERVAAFEKALCREALERARWNQREAAESLGITYDQFRHLYRKYGITKAD